MKTRVQNRTELAWPSDSGPITYRHYAEPLLVFWRRRSARQSHIRYLRLWTALACAAGAVPGGGGGAPERVAIFRAESALWLSPPRGS